MGREETRERSCNSSPMFEEIQKEAEAQKIGLILGLDSESQTLQTSPETIRNGETSVNESLKVEDKHLLDFWEHIFGENSRTPNQEQLREMIRVPSDESFTDELQLMWKCKWNEWRRVRFLNLLGPQFFNPVELNLDNGSVQVRFANAVVKDYRRLFRNDVRGWDYFEKRFLERAQVSVTKSSSNATEVWKIQLKLKFLEAFLTEYNQYRDDNKQFQDREQLDQDREPLDQDREPLDPLMYLNHFVAVAACRQCRGKGCWNCSETGFRDNTTLSERQKTLLRNRVNKIEEQQKFIREARLKIHEVRSDRRFKGIIKLNARLDRRKAQAPCLPPIQLRENREFIKLPAE